MRVCIFADACDAAAAQQVLHALPADAYGHLFLVSDPWTVSEADSPLEGPARVQITLVTPRPGRHALAEAMTGWAAEWLPSGVTVSASPTVWVLPGASAALSAAGHECVTHLITALPSDQLIHG